METIKTIIDTDILIDLLRNKQEAVTLVARLEERNFLLSTTVVNAFELHYGAHKSKQPEKNLQSTKKLLSRLVLLPLTPRSAQKAGHICRTRRERPINRAQRYTNWRNRSHKRVQRRHPQC